MHIMLIERICLMLFLPFWSLATQDDPLKNTEESLTVIDLRSTSKPLDEQSPSPTQPPSKIKALQAEKRRQRLELLRKNYPASAEVKKRRKKAYRQRVRKDPIKLAAVREYGQNYRQENRERIKVQKHEYYIRKKAKFKQQQQKESKLKRKTGKVDSIPDSENTQRHDLPPKKRLHINPKD